MNYKRIFGLRQSTFVTIDPGSFEITNTFDYAELKKLKVGNRKIMFVLPPPAVSIYVCRNAAYQAAHAP